MRELWSVVILLLVALGALAWSLWKLRQPDRYRISGSADPAVNGYYYKRSAPPLARGFLRGGRFRHGSRDDLRLRLYRLSALATRTGDEEAARLLEHTALALHRGGAVVSAGALVSVDGARAPDIGPEVLADHLAGEDLRQVDRRELERRKRLDARTPPGSPVFRNGRVVGFLRGQETILQSLSFPGGVTMFRQRGAWTTDASDDLLLTLSPNVFRVAGLLLFLALGGLLAPAAHAAGRTYHAEALAWVAAESPGSAEVPTHIRIEGEVAYVAREADGDVHIRLCHNARCMVAECIPSTTIDSGAPAAGRGGQAACMRVRIGQRIAVWGISRYDGAPGHGERAEGAEGRQGHWEVHPAEGIEVLP